MYYQILSKPKPFSKFCMISLILCVDRWVQKTDCDEMPAPVHPLNGKNEMQKCLKVTELMNVISNLTPIQPKYNLE